MNQSSHGFRLNPGRPPGWRSYLLLAPLLVASVVLGVFFFTLFMALFAVAALVFGARLWWLRRKLRKAAAAGAAGQPAVLDGEYTVVHEEIRHTEIRRGRE